MDKNLLPCPFCGGKATVWIDKEVGHGYVDSKYYVKCDSCHAQGPSFNTRESTESKCVRACTAHWNQRINASEYDEL